MTPEKPYTLCIDVGSPKKIGWASSDGDCGLADRLDHALAEVARILASSGKAAIGFESPQWIFSQEKVFDCTKSRGGIELVGRSRPWSAGGGAFAMAAGLALMLHCFDTILRHHGSLTEVTATVDLARFIGGDARLLVFESFISGDMKNADSAQDPRYRSNPHISDARCGLDAFNRDWPKVKSGIPSAPGQRVMNYAAASALRCGMNIKIDELGLPSLVVGPKKAASSTDGG